MISLHGACGAESTIAWPIRGCPHCCCRDWTKAAGILSDSGQSSEAVGESDLQNVIRYLRRSKETVCFKTLVHIALYLFFSSPCRRQCFMLWMFILGWLKVWSSKEFNGCLCWCFLSPSKEMCYFHKKRNSMLHLLPLVRCTEIILQ